jgi:elongation factor G
VTLKQRRNFGLSAHVDAGKTTLAERMLFLTGRIHKVHEVRGGGRGPALDFDPVEREKGITIQSAATSFLWAEHALTLIDTPGHFDFTVEVERALRVLDGAVLVLCGVSGVQAQTVTVDRQMRRHGVARVAFVNKCDLDGADPERVVKQLRERLGLNAVLVQSPVGLGRAFDGILDLVRQECLRFEGEFGEVVVRDTVPDRMRVAFDEARAALIAAIADTDDGVAEQWLEQGDVSATLLDAALRRATLAGTVLPVFVGAARRSVGVQPLLDGVVRYLPSPEDRPPEVARDLERDADVALEPRADAPCVAFVFKVEHTAHGAAAFCRVYQGTVNTGDRLTNARTGARFRVARIARRHGAASESVEVAGPGEIVTLFGTDSSSGDTLTDGAVACVLGTFEVPDPILHVALRLKDRSRHDQFAAVLRRLTRDDPTLRATQDPESGETILAGLGEVQLDVALERLRDLAGVDVEAGPPRVAYRESPTERVEFQHRHKKQTGGPGEFAELAGHVGPSEDGVDFVFINHAAGGAIPQGFVSACEVGARHACVAGPLLGAPVVGVEVVVNDGVYHRNDSSEHAFRRAAREAVRDALSKARVVLLEPRMQVDVRGPEEALGGLLTLLAQRRGEIRETRCEGGEACVRGLVPLAELFGFSTALKSVTRGYGSLGTEFAGYHRVPESVTADLVREAEQRAK